MTEEEAANSENVETESNDDVDTPKDPKDFIIKRKEEQLAKAKQRQQELEEELKVFKPSQAEPDSMEALLNQRLEREEKISAFIKEYPQLEEHREKIKKYAYDPSRKNIPVDEVIAGAIGFQEFIKLGSKIRLDADEEAKQGKMGGGTPKGEQKTSAEQKKQAMLNKIPRFLQGSAEAYQKLNS